MENNSIEILGQKFSYPTTWQGAFAITVICACIAFLGSTLNQEEIDSWARMFNRNSEEAYNQSLTTIEKQRDEIIALTNKVLELSQKANLSGREKAALAQELDSTRGITENAIVNLRATQEQRVRDWEDISENLSRVQRDKQLEAFSNQKQQIFNQLTGVQTQKAVLKRVE